MGINNNAASLLAAASVIALSVGMEPALADGQNNNGILIGLSKQDKTASNQQKGSQQIKGESYTVKMGGSGQYKQESTYLKYESQQHKMDANHIKMNANHIKMDANHIKMESQQSKGSSLQQKMAPKALNPQPEPPG